MCLRVEAIGCLSMPSEYEHTQHSICHIESFLSYTACMNQAFLSGNLELLGPGSITASSAMDDDPAEDVIDSGNDVWCTNEAFQSGPAPYIQLNFTKTLSLTYMRARGGMLGFSYVTEFKVEIEDDEGNFIAYGITDPPPTVSNYGICTRSHTTAEISQELNCRDSQPGHLVRRCTLSGDLFMDESSGSISWME